MHVLLPSYLLPVESAMGLLGDDCLCRGREFPLHPGATLQQAGSVADTAAHVVTLVPAWQVSRLVIGMSQTQAPPTSAMNAVTSSADR